MKPRLLVSLCLLGAPCRYDGAKMPLPEETLRALAEKWELLPVCPEQLGGLPTPRVPAERVGVAVVTRDGRDVTEQYHRGAAAACDLARLLDVRAALLKERSPSCGSDGIYDGSFRRVIVPGSGVTAEKLRAMGVAVCGESRVGELL